jgi:hypothetical protein
MLPAVLVGLLVACTGDDGGGTDDPPVLDRIDGPAQVDPSFDPMQQGRGGGDPAAPPTTDPD